MTSVLISAKYILDLINSSQVDRKLMFNTCVECYTHPLANDSAYVSEVIRLIYNNLAYTTTSVATACSEINNFVKEEKLVSDILHNYRVITSAIINSHNNVISLASFDKLDNNTVIFNVNI